MSTAAMRPRARARVTARLAGAVAAILLLFGAAIVVNQVALSRIADAEAQVDELDRAKHAGHMAAAEVREQHIQQAHAIISFDPSHLAHYDRAVAATRAATDKLVAIVTGPDERRLAMQIAERAGQSDREFRGSVLPAIERGDRSQTQQIGARLAGLVDEVVEINTRLDAALERRSTDASKRAAEVRRQATLATVLCFGFAFVLAALVGTLLIRSIVRPMSALSAGARNVGDGDLTARIELRGDDEFAELAATFNRMTIDLGRNQDALVRSQKLASIGHVAAGVAHEINNPLTVILGYAKLIRRDAGGPSAEQARIIEQEAVQCQRIVQGLLDLARPQQLEVTDIELVELARSEVTRLEEAGVLRDRVVAVSPTEGRIVVVGDEGKLRQVIANLIANAAQAAPEGGTISIAVSRDRRSGRLDVTDNGPGIAADVLARVFDPFFTTKRAGTGLGLSIAQAIVDVHGGHLELDSTPGQGTCARMRIPLATSKGHAS